MNPRYFDTQKSSKKKAGDLSSRKESQDKSEPKPLMDGSPPKKKRGKSFATKARAEDRNFAQTASTAAFTATTPIPIRPLSNKASHIDFRKTGFKNSMKNIDISHLLPGDRQRLLKE